MPDPGPSGGPDALEVLLVEHRPGVGAPDAQALEAAGHHVVRCHAAPWEQGEPRHPERFLCDALQGRPCPLDEGIDVVLLVRPRVDPRPTLFEQAVACATRAGVPVVERGPELLDPYAEVVADRVEGVDEVAEACRSASTPARRHAREVRARRRP